MSDNKKPSDEPGAFLPLPNEPGESVKPPAKDAADPAVDMARRKVSSAFVHEPDAAAEAVDVQELGPALNQSKHQKYIYELTNSGKSLEEIQTAWHEYYAALPDSEKHLVWQEFYSAHEQATRLAEAMPKVTVSGAADEETAAVKRKAYEPPKQLHKTIRQMGRGKKELPIEPERRPPKPLTSLFVGLGCGVLVVFILLFSFFNERFIAPLIQPNRNVSNIQLINSGSVSSVSEVIIPKINVEIPTIYGINTIDDNAVNNALEQGVVHYADTANPGQIGNAVYVGHSSNNILNKGKYKFAFVLLHKLENGDIFYLQKDGVRYTYQVTGKKIVSPTDVSVLAASATATASLITCDPPGTSTNRLVVSGIQIAPDPSKDAPATTNSTLASESTFIPGNSPTLWSRLTHWFTE